MKILLETVQQSMFESLALDNEVWKGQDLGIPPQVRTLRSFAVDVLHTL